MSTLGGSSPVSINHRLYHGLRVIDAMIEGL
jgi:hypothetical protein